MVQLKENEQKFTQNLTEPHVSVNNIIHHNVQATRPKRSKIGQVEQLISSSLDQYCGLIITLSGSYNVPDIPHINHPMIVHKIHHSVKLYTEPCQSR